MESIWSKTVQMPAFPQLRGDRTADIAVIGAGMAGVLTAYLLRQKQADVVVLEATEVAGGQTKNTTAKITSQHGLIYHRLAAQFGLEKAGQYAAANEAAIRAYREIARQERIDCALETCPAFLYSTEDAGPLQREAEAAKKLGLPAAFTLETSLPFPIAGAVRFENQAQFHPLAFLKAVCTGLPIFTHTRVLRVEGNRVETDYGTVTAERIVFATHYPFVNVPGYYFMRMHQSRSYVVALKNAPRLDGMYYGVDPNSWSMRNAEGLLLLGGGSHRTGENRTGGQYAALREQAAAFWPGCTESAHWSAQDCMTLDGVPYIGPFSASTPNWYVATGFCKWGMTSSMVAAMLLTDALCGVSNPNAPVFSPLRFTPDASAKTFFKDSMHAVRDLTRQAVAPPRAEIDALPPGHGGVVEYDGQKMGVYKEESGAVHLVSTRCPHMGCQLEWNPDEKTWDCPCHGSRFTCDGALIDNPAQENLPHL